MITNALTFGVLVAVIYGLIGVFTWFYDWSEIINMTVVSMISYAAGWRDCKRLWVAS